MTQWRVEVVRKTTNRKFKSILRKEKNYNLPGEGEEKKKVGARTQKKKIKQDKKSELNDLLKKSPRRELLIFPLCPLCSENYQKTL
jgi:hypothetical protein